MTNLVLDPLQEKRVPVFVAFANDLLEASGTMDARKLRVSQMLWCQNLLLLCANFSVLSELVV